jgi:hypothetical protein
MYNSPWFPQSHLNNYPHVLECRWTKAQDSFVRWRWYVPQLWPLRIL